MLRAVVHVAGQSWRHDADGFRPDVDPQQLQEEPEDRIARWGYSPAILAWELHNEWGHINSTGSPNQYNMIVAVNDYLAATDPYRHVRTTSQNSQAYSPQLWSSSGMDLANYHWYLDGHITSLNPDEPLTVMRFAWCLSAGTAPANTPVLQRSRAGRRLGVDRQQEAVGLGRGRCRAQRHAGQQRRGGQPLPAQHRMGRAVHPARDDAARVVVVSGGCGGYGRKAGRTQGRLGVLRGCRLRGRELRLPDDPE